MSIQYIQAGIEELRLQRLMIGALVRTCCLMVLKDIP